MTDAKDGEKDECKNGRRGRHCYDYHVEGEKYRCVISNLKQENKELRTRNAELEKEVARLKEINDHHPDWWEEHLKNNLAILKERNELRTRVAALEAELREYETK